MWCEVMFRLWEVHTYCIGVVAVGVMMYDTDPTKEADSVHTYEDCQVQH